MGLSVPVIAFLLLAVLIAVGILVVVSLPHLKGSGDLRGLDEADQQEPRPDRHSSRTGR